MDKIFKEVNIPTILVIFGATGDLSRKKLLPALFDLYKHNLLPDTMKIVGVARRELSSDEYRLFAKESIGDRSINSGVSNVNVLDEFLSIIEYRSGDFTTPRTYKELSESLINIEQSFGVCANKLFYLSVSPAHYETIFKELADSGLTIPCSNETGWTRILVEKPFGKDMLTARKLDRTLGLLFKEEQIFRIDHYLGKETLQDILMFRFSNLIFEPVWNREYIERVEITLHEAIDIAGRGAFYDGVGALRDVGQNHILQMLAFVAMERPRQFTASYIRKNRADVLRKIKRIPANALKDHVVRGQYIGYEKEDGVAKETKTETYFRIKAFLDDPRWEGVPFLLESGKALSEKRTEIRIYFKKLTDCFCKSKVDHMAHANMLRFGIQPDESISVLFWAKKPGVSVDIEPKELSFSYEKYREKMVEAYEKILFDAIIGDQTLFTSTEEVSAAWEFITPILENWGDLELYRYEKGSKGPKIDL